MIVIGQIGCGYWGPNLLRVFTNNSDSRVKWVVEPSLARQAFVKREFARSSVTAEIGDVLSDAEVDAVVVASPAGAHAELAIRCLDAGKHVFVEKPLATSLVDVERIEAAARSSGKLVMVGHTFLFNPAVRYIKKLIDQGELGELRYVYAQRLNLGQVRTDVNAWWNLAPHDVSILSYWLDDVAPISVTAQGSCFLRPGIEDVVFAQMCWPSGVMGHIHVSWLDPQKVRRMTLVGSRKMLIYDDISENKITILDKGYDRDPQLGECMHFDQPNPLALTQRSGDAYMPAVAWREPLKLEAEHFIESISQGREPLTGIAHAKEVVRILEQADQQLRRA